jgi:hypothetical protein
MRLCKSTITAERYGLEAWGSKRRTALITGTTETTNVRIWRTSYFKIDRERMRRRQVAKMPLYNPHATVVYECQCGYAVSGPEKRTKMLIRLHHKQCQHKPPPVYTKVCVTVLDRVKGTVVTDGRDPTAGRMGVTLR